MPCPPSHSDSERAKGWSARRPFPEKAEQMDAYKEKLDPLRPVAIRANQNEVYAPGQENWETVACDSCSELFYIGPKHILHARTKPEDSDPGSLVAWRRSSRWQATPKRLRT